MSNVSPKVGFVSLGCPKALVDSERILTQLRVEGYEIVPSYGAADVVVVNTCGFIDSAVQESLDAIGEALAENGKVIVTGCLGKRAELIREAHPDVLAISGPQDYASVMNAVHAQLPPTHDPFTRHHAASPAANDIGIKLTPKHYAYLKISEGCNHRCIVLHHSVDARRSGVAAGRRGADRSREAGQGRRARTARHLAGHQRVRRRREIRAARMARQVRIARA